MDDYALHGFFANDGDRHSRRQRDRLFGAWRDLLTVAERIQYEGYLRREDANAILARAKNGAPIKQIVRKTGPSRGLVRRQSQLQRRLTREFGRKRPLVPIECVFSV